MVSPVSRQAIQSLKENFDHFLTRLPELPNGAYIHEALLTLLRMTEEDIARLDWKILRAALQDMERAFQVFHSYRHVRKIAVFGSARLPEESEEYRIAADFSRAITKQGFMVMTGAGGGIMEAANKGAGASQSFGLNIQLPFEQTSNPFIEGDPKLINFKYFFTRKLFFLREADVVAAFPGGFGTQDEAFECLTLIQTGKSSPIPIVLIDRPGGTYWQTWDDYIEKQLISRALISPEDRQMYTITDNIDVACAAISNFYRVYHSSRYVGEQFVMRLNHDISEEQVASLNRDFSDILISGTIEKSGMLKGEIQHQQAQPQQVLDGTESLPRLVFHFNQRDHGRLYQMIAAINAMGSIPELEHPERK
ncbi:MAG TPA: LOG family protein [Stenomitos sp.]